MEKTIQIKSDYNSLDALQNHLNKTSSYECAKEYDIWEHRVDANGQMEQCLVLKKSGMHAVKINFTKDNTIKMNYVIPNKIMNVYFGKSVKARRNIIEIVADVIKQAVLAGPQQKAFNELQAEVSKVAM